ncbi:hypothetical protein [Haloarchaeobius sp. HRN-SO-5]|uniref:hypothetical protein n=1 Tax=Haloarchaeobius sp. HRN-SO-5 TaxID=3446118 RepID=UPI003EBD847D
MANREDEARGDIDRFADLLPAYDRMRYGVSSGIEDAIEFKNNMGLLSRILLFWAPTQLSLYLLVPRLWSGFVSVGDVTAAGVSATALRATATTRLFLVVVGLLLIWGGLFYYRLLALEKTTERVLERVEAP